jgi:hypothetical protein
MTYMLCRNRVKDFAKWKEVFDSHVEAHQETGLRLVNMWRSVEDSNNIFFLFEVTSKDKAIEFINSPESAKAGEDSGAIDGEVHFVEDASGD